MNKINIEKIVVIATDYFSNALITIKQVLNTLTDWVIQLTWKMFFLFIILVCIIGGFADSLLFDNSKKVVISYSTAPSKNQHLPAPPQPPKAPPAPVDKNVAEIKSNGKNASTTDKPATTAPDEEIKLRSPNTSNDKADDVNDAEENPKYAIDDDEEDGTVVDKNGLKIKTTTQHKTSAFWSLLMISLISLFGVKALMGGKRRAEIHAKNAQQEAEYQTLKRQVAESKMQMMQAQIEPHFLFNTLASVEHLIETDPPRAAAMQHSLIDYLRAVIPQMRDQSVNTNLGREAEIVKAYLTLLKMRMEERLEFNIAIPEGLTSAVFPTMMLQTLVENAIKHGLEPKAEGGIITVSAEVAHNKLRVSVIDNGLGFGIAPTGGMGLGLQNIRERLALLYDAKAQLIISPNVANGVIAIIELPYQITEI